MFTVIGHFTGLGLGFLTVLISHIAFCIPIVVIIVLPKLYEMNDHTLNAARDLGATELQVLNKVMLPHLMPAVIGGFMALTYSLDDFTVSFFVTGNGFSVLSVEVYAMARKGISMEINAISTILFLVIMLGILAYYLIQNTLKHKNIAKRCATMKRFLQLIIISIVVGVICLLISQKFTSKDHSASGEKYMSITGESISILV